MDANKEKGNLVIMVSRQVLEVRQFLLLAE
jgi:hypothetical protein